MSCPRPLHQHQIASLGSDLSALASGFFWPLMFNCFLFVSLFIYLPPPRMKIDISPNARSLSKKYTCLLGDAVATCQRRRIFLQTTSYLEDRNSTGSFTVMAPAGQAWTHRHSINKCHATELSRTAKLYSEVLAVAENRLMSHHSYPPCLRLTSCLPRDTENSFKKVPMVCHSSLPALKV